MFPHHGLRGIGFKRAIVAAFIVLIFPGFGAALLFVIISIAVLILGIELIVSGIRGRGITPI